MCLFQAFLRMYLLVLKCLTLITWQPQEIHLINLHINSKNSLLLPDIHHALCSFALRAPLWCGDSLHRHVKYACNIISQSNLFNVLYFIQALIQLRRKRFGVVFRLPTVKCHGSFLSITSIPQLGIQIQFAVALLLARNTSWLLLAAEKSECNKYSYAWVNF